MKEKVAILTGGSKGIGLATARLFAKEGARVVITGRNLKALGDAGSLIEGEVLAIQTDVSDLANLEQMYQEVHQKFGKIDILFVNAGIAERISVDEASEAAFDRIVNINYKGAFFTVQKAVNYFNEGASVFKRVDCCFNGNGSPWYLFIC